MNSIVLLGRLVKDPEVRYTQSGKVVCQFTLAVNRPFAKEGDVQTDFIPVVVWGKTAEVCGNGLQKGQRALVEGRLQIRSYEKDGAKRWVSEVIANNFEFIEKKGDAAPKQGTNSNSSPMDSFGSATPFDENIPVLGGAKHE